MSSLLRSTKFIRSIAGAARTLIINSSKSYENNLILHNSRGLAPVTTVIRDLSSKYTDRVEPLLQRIDADVRRHGRIQRRDIDEIFAEIRNKYSLTTTQSLLIIRCCGELLPDELPEQRTQLVQGIWNVLLERGVPLDISHYNALLRVYIENEHQFSPAEFLNELEKKGLQPNRVTYQRLMWRYCQSGDVEGATRVLEKMRELSLPVSEPVLNALVMGHAYLGDTDGARAVLETMAAAGLQPSNRTYSLLASGFAKKGDIEGIKETIKQCTEKEIFLSDLDLMDVIESLAISGHSENIDEVIKHLQKGTGYNQDTLNLILKLINKGQDEVALKMFKTMTKPTNLDSTDLKPYQGAFFVRQLVKADRPVEVIIPMCKRLQDEDLAPRALNIAAEAAVQHGRVELAKKLFLELKDESFPIRQHYFWPLLVQKGSSKDIEGLFEVLRSMINEFELTPSGETLREYVIPYLKQKFNPEQTVLQLQGVGLRSFHSARNVIIDLLEDGKLKEAADISLQFRPQGKFPMLHRPLTNALYKTKDVNSFAIVLHVCYSEVKNTQNESSEEVQSEVTAAHQDIGRIIYDGVKNLHGDIDLIEKLFKQLFSKGIGISTTWAEKIQEALGDKLSTQVSDLLSKLTSADLEVQPIQETNGRRVVRTSHDLEKSLAQVQVRGGNTASIYRQLISVYVREGEKDKLIQLLARLESEQFVLTAGTLAQLIEFFSQQDDVESAMKYREQMLKKDPDFVINDLKSLKLAGALVRANKFDEALQVLNTANREGKLEYQTNFLNKTQCWQILNYLAENTDAEKVQLFLTTLLEKNYAETSNFIFGPLVKVHLLKDDILAALKTFEECCNKYRVTPFKFELTKRLINTEDAARLQHLTDLSTGIHGEDNSLYDLVVAFVECGRLRQARRILETPGLKNRTQRLSSACERYVQEGKTEYLEGLIEATKELSHIDRSEIFYHLLVSYCKADDTGKALDLWTLLQEECQQPSDKFLNHLGNYLLSKNMAVPFTMPESQTVEKSEKPEKKVKAKDTAPQTTTAPQIDFNDPLVKLKKALSTKDIDQALSIKRTLVKGHSLSKRVYCDMIEQLSKTERINEAASLILESHKSGINIPLAILISVLKQVSDLNLLTELGNVLSNETKKLVSYETHVARIKFVSADSADEVSRMEKLLETASDAESYKNIEKIYPRSQTLAVLEEQKPDLYNRCVAVAKKLADKGYTVPINIHWNTEIIEGRHKEADEIWNQYLINSDKLLFRRILNAAFIENKTSIVEKLVECLKSNKNFSTERPSALGSAYSRWIDILISHNKVSEAKDVLDKILASGITLDVLNDRALLRLKGAIEATGEQFAYTLPNKETQSPKSA